MKLFGRRAAMRFMGAGVVAAPQAAQAVAEAAAGSLGSAGFNIASARKGVQVAGDSRPNPMPPDPVKEALRATLRAAESENEIIMARRWNGMDADIASLRLPMATKARMQTERDLARRSWLEKLRDQLYGGY